MGAVEVKYKHSRGTNEAGAIIVDPKDWMRELLINDFASTKAMYEAAPEATQAAIDEVFGEKIFTSVHIARTWVVERQDDYEGQIEFGSAKERLEKILNP